MAIAGAAVRFLRRGTRRKKRNKEDSMAFENK